MCAAGICPAAQATDTRAPAGLRQALLLDEALLFGALATTGDAGSLGARDCAARRISMAASARSESSAVLRAPPAGRAMSRGALPLARFGFSARRFFTFSPCLLLGAPARFLRRALARLGLGARGFRFAPTSIAVGLPRGVDVVREPCGVRVLGGVRVGRERQRLADEHGGLLEMRAAQLVARAPSRAPPPRADAIVSSPCCARLDDRPQLRTCRRRACGLAPTRSSASFQRSSASRPSASAERLRDEAGKRAPFRSRSAWRYWPSAASISSRLGVNDFGRRGGLDRWPASWSARACCSAAADAG